MRYLKTYESVNDTKDWIEEIVSNCKDIMLEISDIFDNSEVTKKYDSWSNVKGELNMVTIECKFVVGQGINKFTREKIKNNMKTVKEVHENLIRYMTEEGFKINQYLSNNLYTHFNLINGNNLTYNISFSKELDSEFIAHLRYLKKYNLFESIDSQFDAVYKSRKHGSKYDGDIELITYDIIEKLNNKNGNFKPSIIKDLFIDLFDDDVLEKIEFLKTYSVERYEGSFATPRSNKYIRYVITAKIYFKDNRFTKENCEKREKYLEKREEVFEVLKDYYGHKNLNSRLSKWNIFDDDRLTSVFRNSFDEIDLWGLSLDLQTLK